MQRLSAKDGDLGSLILFTISFVCAGCAFAIICVGDFLASGWNIWNVKRLVPFAALAASCLALLWRYGRYNRYKREIKGDEAFDYGTDEEGQGVWPPPPRPPG